MNQIIKYCLLSFFLIFISINQSFAQVDIEEKHRVPNFSPGYCAWASIETLGRHNGVKNLINLAKNRSKEPLLVEVEYGPGQFKQEKRNVGTDYGIYRKLNSLGIRYRMQWGSNYSHELINYAMKNKLGCCFVIRSGWFGPNSEAHAMVLIDFKDKTVECIDPNHIDRIYVYTREWFDKHWSGTIIVIERIPQRPIVNPPQRPKIS